MPTTAESRALAFFAGLFALGGLLRAAATWRDSAPAAAAADSVALARHLESLESARTQSGDATGRRRAKPKPGAAAATRTTEEPPPPPSGLPPELAAVTGWFVRRAPDRPHDRPHDRPPDRVATPVAGHRRPHREDQGNAGVPGASTVDLDLADEATIEALPGIGPSLARRLVADRTLHGPFGSLEGLARVKGVGPVLRARLADRVTFSGLARPE
jgi:hypothetical protein